MGKKIYIAGREFVLREFLPRDAHNPQIFLDFLSNLNADPASMTTINEVPTLDEEEEWLRYVNSETLLGQRVTVLAEHCSQLVGVADIRLYPGKSSHVGELGISISREEFRSIGLGTAMVKKLLKLGMKRLDPAPQMLRLSMFGNNQRAKSLYQKFGFREVARIPDQVEFQGELVDEIIMLKLLKP